MIFWEEPLIHDDINVRLELIDRSDRLTVARLLVPDTVTEREAYDLQKQHLDALIAAKGIARPVLWYYSPLSLRFSDHLAADFVIYDCMDELSAFQGAHPGIRDEEARLLSRADLVFTGGHSLYEAKRDQHSDIHPFPSSVDAAHFRPARHGLPEPEDQRDIPRSRLGFYGVIDERFDVDLLAAIADARPAWQFVMVGPVVKISPGTLPARRNIHYLGGKSYDALPGYVAGWDVALMPFARNEATRFISPTKLPEYLAAGRPVVSTPIVDVVRHYGDLTGVAVAATPEEFVAACEQAMSLKDRDPKWLSKADQILDGMSWDKTWDEMSRLITKKYHDRQRPLLSLVSSSRDTPHGSSRAPHLGRRVVYDYLVVGGGFAGSVLAERLARDSGARVLLVDRRGHVGGNAYDEFDKAGVLVHRYGPHIFHTNAERIVQYLSRFTAWRPYEHRVLASVRDDLLPVPINRTTINRFFGLELGEAEIESFLATKASHISDIRTSEDIVLSRVGRELYEAFFRGYTRKQWGLDPASLDKSVAGRLPVRTNDDDRYFSDSFQKMPRNGYTRMFENMLDHPNITLMLRTSFQEVAREVDFKHLIFTGPVDEYFDHRLGKLPYRSLRFQHETLDCQQYQPVAVVNYPSPEIPYTRITEYKHLTGQSHPRTSVSYEFPGDDGDPYYPVPHPESAALYARYQALADRERGVTFVGRLATYRYYNMDQVVAQALAVYDRLKARGLEPRGLEAERGTTERLVQAAS